VTSLATLRRQASEWKQGLRHQAAIRRARPSLPPLPARLAPLLDSLERTGAAMTSLEELGGDPRLLPELDAVLARARTQVSQAILEWALGEDLIALCANYIGLPVAYRGVAVRRDIANGQMSGTRLWHRDGEDYRILKYIVYVNDVDEGTGPFEYVPKQFAPPTWRVSLHDGNRVDEAEFDRLVPQEYRKACTGTRGTVVVVDTCAVYHRGRVPERKDRLTAFYAFNSVQPIRPEHCQPLFDRSRFAAVHSLSPLQRSTLNYQY
jgi:hypothetical protein